MENTLYWILRLGRPVDVGRLWRHNGFFLDNVSRLNGIGIARNTRSACEIRSINVFWIRLGSVQEWKSSTQAISIEFALDTFLSRSSCGVWNGQHQEAAHISKSSVAFVFLPLLPFVTNGYERTEFVLSKPRSGVGFLGGALERRRIIETGAAHLINWFYFNSLKSWNVMESECRP